jgi:hypothetical protein
VRHAAWALWIATKAQRTDAKSTHATTTQTVAVVALPALAEPYARVEAVEQPVNHQSPTAMEPARTSQTIRDTVVAVQLYADRWIMQPRSAQRVRAGLRVPRDGGIVMALRATGARPIFLGVQPTVARAADRAVVRCPEGQRIVGTSCVAATGAPRPVAPISLGDVTSRRPTLRWVLPAGFDGAVVELCRDRACTMPLETLTVSGTQVRPTRDLPARSVVFWRLRGRVGTLTDTRYGPTWLFHVPAFSVRGGIDTSSTPHLDVNADGFDDVVVGAIAYASPSTGRGTVRVVHGGVAGIGSEPTLVLDGEMGHRAYGASVGCAGDLNGDGFADLVVCDQSDVYSVSVFWGSSLGVLATAASVIAEVGTAAGLGDVNGDGYADLAVGTSRDGVLIFHGNAAGIALSTTLEQVVELPGLVRVSMAGAGDVNGDGYNDLVLGISQFSSSGAGYNGMASIFHGSVGGIVRTPAITIEGVGEGNDFASSVAGAGDINGDGYSDLVVRAHTDTPGPSSDPGTVRVFSGSAMGIVASAETMLHGYRDYEVFGSSVSSAGDVNGDGYADIVIGAPGDLFHRERPVGLVYVFHGAATGLRSIADQTFRGSGRDDNYFGGSSAGAGDINQDGYADVVVGSIWTGSGGVITYDGSATGCGTTPSATHDISERYFRVTVASVDPLSDHQRTLRTFAPLRREPRWRLDEFEPCRRAFSSVWDAWIPQVAHRQILFCAGVKVSQQDGVFDG